ncbi:ribosomal RNA large subunit methyltransferase N [Candidatus Photodesmus katoptron]|uniref:Dual-specificity RNA methyltransferase RlmN n=1 Tax=Candidatus Photodesmus katoptron Akat1 TaxID=1236703 RepID=S3DG20_9GAMM|nr:UPF0063 protein YfgB [Candidatus Photodesmus katoptron Akat1]KEY89987.1 ribosomal RNA large subunit methyltransferase N [Candidatus Photodesmus katoptron]
MRSFFVEELKEKAFRAEQVMKWIYHFGVNDFDKMTNLNKKLIKKLKFRCKIQAPLICKTKYSIDGTIKWLMRVGDQNIETVYIPENARATLCVSSQVGCALNCSFCSTAQQGFNRNLKVSEIIGQVWQAAREIVMKKQFSYYPISNIVIMGMGEPLLNVKNLLPALRLMLDDFAFGLSKRHVTVSTSGIVSGINKMTGNIDVALALSLHAPNDTLRNSIMSINHRWGIKELLESVRRYISSSHANRGKVTLEYVLLDHINDEVDHACELAELMKDTPCKINLIPFNSYPGSIYNRTSSSRMSRFFKKLIEYNYTVTVRKIRGADIDAACGQLVGGFIDRTSRDNSIINAKLIP